MYQLLLLFALCFFSANAEKYSSSLNAVVMKGEYDHSYELVVNKSVEYILIYNSTVS